MNSFKKLLALMLLVTVFSQSARADFQSNIRTIGLTATGAVLSYYSLTTLKTIVDKILEENPAIDERTLSQKINSFLRYGFGFTTSALGTLLGVLIIAQSNSELNLSYKN